MSKEMMRAQVVEAFGGPEVLVERSVPVPRPRDTEVLVRVVGAGINPVDQKTRAGAGVAAWCAAPMPWIVGWDVAGAVVEVGPGVTDLRVGDAVYGLLELPGAGQGAYAEYVRVPAAHLARAPRSLPLVTAAAVPLAALTASQALTMLRVGAGDRVLVHGASGGVGHFAVQLTRARGARVVAVTSTANAAFVHALGADEIVDRSVTSFEDVIRTRGIDAVLDTQGGDTLVRSLAALSQAARIVTIPSPAPAELTHRGEPVPWFLVQPSRSELTTIADAIDDGALRVHVQKTFALHDAARAHGDAERTPVRGKLVLDVAG